MLNTYIKNQGTTQTIIHDNNRNYFNQVNWDADYDGNTANISVNLNADGKRDKFNISLDNEDLANILTIPSVNTPIDKRLKMDFQGSTDRPDNLFSELPTSEIESIKPTTVEELISKVISSPSVNEELLVPLTIDKKTMDYYTHTPKKKHRRPKTHITHRVYKKRKSSKSTKSSKSKTKSKKSQTKKRTLSMPIIDLINSIYTPEDLKWDKSH